jgi:phosphate transport system permease protein
MNAAMVNIGSSDVTGDSEVYRSLFAIGLVLFCMTFLMNVIGSYVSSRYKEKYE